MLFHIQTRQKMRNFKVTYEITTQPEPDSLSKP